MRGKRPNWLIRALGLAGLAVAATWPVAGHTQVREARICATETENTADDRIAACGKLLESGRLGGKPLGVAYGLRGLAFLDRGDIPHAIADLNRAVELAPDFAPAYQNRGNAWYARGNYGQALADYDATIQIDPNSPSPPCGATSVTSTARWRITRRRSASAPTAPRPTADAVRSICASAILAAPSPISTAPCGCSRSPAITCCARKPARAPATWIAR